MASSVLDLSSDRLTLFQGALFGTSHCKSANLIYRELYPKLCLRALFQLLYVIYISFSNLFIEAHLLFQVSFDINKDFQITMYIRNEPSCLQCPRTLIRFTSATAHTDVLTYYYFFHIFIVTGYELITSLNSRGTLFLTKMVPKK